MPAASQPSLSPAPAPSLQGPQPNDETGGNTLPPRRQRLRDLPEGPAPKGTWAAEGGDANPAGGGRTGLSAGTPGSRAGRRVRMRTAPQRGAPTPPIAHALRARKCSCAPERLIVPRRPGSGRASGERDEHLGDEAGRQVCCPYHGGDGAQEADGRVQT